MEDTFADSARHCFTEAGGIRFHYVVSGQGPTVVLVAGFPQSCYAWRRIIPILATKYKVIAIDLPGQGDSDKPNDGYDTQKIWKTTTLYSPLRVRKVFNIYAGLIF